MRNHPQVVSANTLAAAPKIARAKPRLSERITKELLDVSNAEYESPECRAIAIGHAVRAFVQFLGQIEDKTPVVAFLRASGWSRLTRIQLGKIPFHWVRIRDHLPSFFATHLPRTGNLLKSRWVNRREHL